MEKKKKLVILSKIAGSNPLQFIIKTYVGMAKSVKVQKNWRSEKNLQRNGD